MAGASGYGALQQPGGGYGASQSPVPLYAANTQAKPGAPAASSSPAAPLNADQVTDAMMAYFAQAYLDTYFPKQNVPQLRVGKKIPYELVSDQGMEAALKKQAELVYERLLKGRFDLNMPWVEEKLHLYYDSDKLGKPRPYPYSKANPPTLEGLDREEKAALFGALKSGRFTDMSGEAAHTVAFFQRPDTPGATGKMFVRKLAAEDPTSQSELAGTIAHELGHAYADANWWEFYDIANAFDLPLIEKLTEGIATTFEEKLSRAWWDQQPGGTELPMIGYRNDKDIMRLGPEFFKILKQAGYEAYFGGWIKVGNVNNVANTIIVGQSKTRWSWPWKAKKSGAK
ncbi:hypothetical protein [Sphingomonas alpina]|uniref:Uncharacterized protein n=1 Tax=Sphingomonas alpina TaxID=653931 RepID=A0A7H0LGQ8_9SPHN|nr:hypothetical protein [Sphingomonas alpina]QNQ08861.1 hypothetical protein H3Z74_19420 [Sphingomonas alpina]